MQETTRWQASTKLVAVVKDKKDEIMSCWIEWVLNDPDIPVARNLDQRSLSHTVSQLIDEILDGIDGRHGQRDAVAGHGRAAREHSHSRACQKFSLSEAIAELAHLRRAISRTCERDRSLLPALESVHSAIDRTVMLVTSDICRFQQAELSRRRASDNRLRLILENVRDYAIMTVDTENAITTWSLGATRITGYTEEEVIGRTGELLFTPEDRARDVCGYELAKAAEQGRAEDIRWHLRKDGSRFWATGFTTAVRDEEGRLCEFVKIFRDETERKQYESERERLVRDLDSASRMKDLFLAMLSHELRTPLNVIGGYVAVLRSASPAEDKELYDEALQAIERNAKVQTRLVDDLLDVSRIIAGKLSMDMRPLAFGEVVEAAIAAIRFEAKEKKIWVKYQSKQVGMVWGDAGRLYQVVSNLLGNALKFTFEEGFIEVWLSQKSGCVELVIKDTGRGIKPDMLPYIFDLYEQVDERDSRKYGGMGLGLALVKQIVELHGGTVRAESEGDNKGATFCVSLPSL